MNTQPQNSVGDNGVSLEQPQNGEKSGDNTQGGAKVHVDTPPPVNDGGGGCPQTSDDRVTKIVPTIKPGEVIKNSISSSLANLLIYSSDDSDECDDTDDTPILDKTVILSSADENDSESDSDTPHVETAYSSSDSDSDELCFAGTKKKSLGGLPPTSYDELNGKELPATPDLSGLKLDIQEQDCVHMGTIGNIVDKLVMVEALPGIPAYDLDTLLFLDKGKRPLGFVFDVIGQVTSPMYAVRFNSKAEIESHNITKGSPVYSAPKSKYTQYVFLQQLMQIKGSDASWSNDTEVPLEYLDFSDDEMEYQRHKASKRSEMKRKRNSLERHQKFESEMNQKNIAETSRHVPRREAPSYSLFGYSKTNNNGGNAFSHTFATATPANAVCYHYYPPSVYAAPQPRFVPMPHPAYVNAPPNVMPGMPYNPMMYEPMASPFSYLFTPPPPPPEEPKQDVQTRTPIPPTTTTTAHQQTFQRWPNGLP